MAPMAPFVRIGITNYQNPVEQQTPGGMTQPDRSLWVVNPTIGTPDVRFRIVAGLGLVFALVFGASPTLAVPAKPLDLGVGWSAIQLDRRIEKQSWFLDCCQYDPDHTVVNPGGIGTWDINDHVRWGASGYLSPGASTSTTWRHIFDWNPIYSCRPLCASWSSVSNRWGVLVRAPSAALAVTVCYAPQGRCLTANPVWNAVAKMYEYANCSQVVYTDSDPTVVAIPDSNGGLGVPTTLTVTVTNTDLRLVKNIAASWGLASDVFTAPGCSSNPNVFAHSEYPFRWSP